MVDSMYHRYIRVSWEENPWVDHVVVGDGISIIDKIVEGKETKKILFEGFKSMSEFPSLDFDIIADCYPKDQRYSYPSFGRKSVDFMFSKGCFRECEVLCCWRTKR